MKVGADLDRYADWKGWAAETFGVFTREEAAYFAAELRRAFPDADSGLEIFELGFGNGAFAGWACAQGHGYSGSERIPELLSRASAAGFQVFDADADSPFAKLGPESLDIVVAFDVLEHMELALVEEVLRDVRAALRPGGCLLARVPSGDSPFGRGTLHGDLTHRLALGSSAVRQLAVRGGFTVADIGPPRLPLRGVGVRRAVRRALILSMQKPVAKFINLVFHHGHPLVITSSLVFVLRKPEGS